jgi:hypothetical protein
MSARPPEPNDIRRVALKLWMLALWLEQDPDAYDADSLARELEDAGVLTSSDWAPAQWIIDAVSAIRGAG